MKVLAIGDICGSAGCNALLRHLPLIKKEYGVDFTVVNGENSDDSNGISPSSAELIFAAGADVITGGNHTLRRTDFHSLLDSNPFLLRPDNIDAKYGSGYCTVDLGYMSVAVINLLGKIYLEKSGASNPFTAVDVLIDRAKSDGAKIILVDFHAEATSEKRAMGFYLDGKVSALFGTHTHVQTNDAQILPLGTAYMTDLGMTGPLQSVLGVKSEIIINRLRDNAADKFYQAEGDCSVEGLLIEIDNSTAKAVDTKIIRIL